MLEPPARSAHASGKKEFRGSHQQSRHILCGETVYLARSISQGFEIPKRSARRCREDFRPRTAVSADRQHFHHGGKFLGIAAMLMPDRQQSVKFGTKLSLLLAGLFLSALPRSDLCAQSPTKVKVTMAAKSFSTLPWYFGQAKGIFRKEGVD